MNEAEKVKIERRRYSERWDSGRWRASDRDCKPSV